MFGTELRQRQDPDWRFLFISIHISEVNIHEMDEIPILVGPVLVLCSCFLLLLFFRGGGGWSGAWWNDLELFPMQPARYDEEVRRRLVV